ncbi:peptidyl-prolyl cis-trans isomerase [Sulfurimonas sp. MAG313]|nr:peptidyl-prolyl cis-trans isomerase [Sulfurimonas sp. MAG313]MDF1881199.1 peptidyl-prolyl cis-trans isomerase [Sulfurimonas sp. MAG313]
MKKLFLLCLLTPLLFADVIGGIAITVDDETITLYEIKQEQEISKQSMKKTVDTLIRSKLEEIEATKRHISINNQQILDELKKMAARNKMTLPQLYEAMQSARGLVESQVKAKTRERLLKAQLFNAIAMSKMQEPTDEEIQEYYDLHLDSYIMPTSIDTVIYNAKDKALLKKKIENPMMYLPQVTTENASIQTAKINPRIAELMIQTEDNHFTPILPKPGSTGYMAFYILQKNDINTPPLALIKDKVKNKVMQNTREHILNEHFQRMRINASIKVLRLPKE